MHTCQELAKLTQLVFNHGLAEQRVQDLEDALKAARLESQQLGDEALDQYDKVHAMLGCNLQPAGVN